MECDGIAGPVRSKCLSMDSDATCQPLFPALTYDTIDAQSRSVESTIDPAEVCVRTAVQTAVQTAVRTDSLASERKSISFNDLACLQQDTIGEAALEMQINILTLNCWGLWLASRRRSERMR